MQKPECPPFLQQKLLSRLDLTKPQDILVIAERGLLVRILMQNGRNRTWLITSDPETAREAIEDYEMDPSHVFLCDPRLKSREWERLFKGMKFDVIIGNPPYQPPIKKTGKGNGSGNKIWHKFVELAFSLCKDGGDVVMVTPSNWARGNFRNGQHRKAQELMWSNSILWVEDAKPHFPQVSTNPTAWHIRKNGQKTETVHFELDKRRIYPLNRDPAKLSILEKFFKTCFTDPDPLVCVEDYIRLGPALNKERDDVFQYRYVATSAQFKNETWNWSSRVPENFEKMKVIFGESRSLGARFVSEPIGALFHFVIEDQTQGEKLASFINSPLVSFVMNSSTPEGEFRRPSELILRLPHNILTSTNPLEEVFQLTKDEIQMISKEN